MYYRVLLATLLLLGSAAAQERGRHMPPTDSDLSPGISNDNIDPYAGMSIESPSLNMTGTGGGKASISGLVLDLNGKPVPKAAVQLVDFAHFVTIASVETSNKGTFEFFNTPPGNYAVIASTGVDTAQQSVIVNGSDVQVDLRLSINSISPDGSTTVSVGQLQVPGKARREYQKATSAFQHGKDSDARKHDDRALEIAPHFVPALTLRALLDMHEKNETAAEQVLRQAIGFEPSSALPYLLLGAVLNNQGRFDDAAPTLERGLELNPKAWKGWFELGKAALERERFQDALRAATRAEELQNGYPQIHLLRAHSLLALHRYQDSIDEYQQYLAREKIGPGVEIARNNIQRARNALAQNTQK